MKHKFLFISIPLLLLASLYVVSRQISPAQIREYFEVFGAWTVLAYILAYTIAVWIPHLATILTVVGGLLFGPVYAFFLVITLSTFASGLPFLFARKINKQKVQQWLEKKGYKKYIHKVNKDSFLYVVYLRLLPILPYELQNYLIGLTNISLKKFYLATGLGLLPGTLGLVLLGETIANTTTTNIIILSIVTVLVMLIPLVLRKIKKPEDVLEG